MATFAAVKEILHVATMLWGKGVAGNDISYTTSIFHNMTLQFTH